VKRFIPWLALLTCPVVLCDEPAKPTTVQAVMYEFTYDAQTLAITHAQVIGGYPSVDECRAAMPRVAAVGAAAGFRRADATAMLRHPLAKWQRVARC